MVSQRASPPLACWSIRERPVQRCVRVAGHGVVMIFALCFVCGVKTMLPTSTLRSRFVTGADTELDANRPGGQCHRCCYESPQAAPIPLPRS
jgi:hypothetical protein